jgi:hypothetical protein
MKRWLLRLGLAAFTFTFGYGVYFFTRTVVINNQLRSEPLAYCQVARNAESYHDSEILVSARIVVNESGVYVYEDCDPVEALAAGVEINREQALIGPAYVDNLLLTDGPKRQTAQALIKGRFDAYASTGCWAPKFRIYAERVELQTSLTDYNPPQTDDVPTRTKH